MARATSLDEIEAAMLAGLRPLIDAEVAFTARRDHAAWVARAVVGLDDCRFGDVRLPAELVRSADRRECGDAICYESPAEMSVELARALAQLGLRSVCAVPIVSSDECVGALAIGRPVPSRFSARDRALVKLFTAHMGALLGKRDGVASFETLAESVPSIVLRADPDGWINWYSHRWYEYTGQTPEEAAGWGWQTAMHPAEFPRVIEEWPRALETGQAVDFESRLRRFDGEYQWHLAHMEPVRDDSGSILSWCGSLTNIEPQKQAVERGRRLADSLQESFLPQKLPTRDYLRFDATYVSAETDALVGGDWYDAFDLPDGRLGFSIGDVAGHGLDASLQVGKLRQTIYTLALSNQDPAEVLRGVNNVLHCQEPGLFATALVGFIDPEGTSISYATAGHPPPMVAYRTGRPATLLATGGPPLGVVDDFELTKHSVAIFKDMIFALYTDGMTEFAHDAIAAETKLQSVLSSLVGDTSRPHLARSVYESVLDDCAPRDDAALLLIQFSQTPVAASPGTNQEFLKKHWRFHASDAQAAHVARREVGAYIERMAGETDATFMSELIVGELLANTVEHAPGLVNVTLQWANEHAELTVADSGPGLTSLRKSLPADDLHEGSRGLFLVHKFSPQATLTTSPAGGAEIRVILPIKRISRDAHAPRGW